MLTTTKHFKWKYNVIRYDIINAIFNRGQRYYGTQLQLKQEISKNFYIDNEYDMFLEKLNFNRNEFENRINDIVNRYNADNEQILVIKLDEISDILMRNMNRDTLELHRDFYQEIDNYCLIKSEIHTFPVMFLFLNNIYIDRLLICI